MNGVCPAHNRLEEKLDEQIKHCHQSTTEVREDINEIKITVTSMDGKLCYLIKTINELKDRRRRFQDKVNIGVTIFLVTGALVFISRAVLFYIKGE
jgi:predicted RNase H-like nuclease (RuvC/YqgF family)